MAVALFAAALLAHAPTPPPTARVLYSECELYVASQAARAANGNEGPEEGLLCELETFGQVNMNEAGVEPRFCAPATVVEARDSAVQMARAYMTFYERRREVRDTPEGGTVFRLALADKWPCPR